MLVEITYRDHNWSGKSNRVFLKKGEFISPYLEKIGSFRIGEFVSDFVYREDYEKGQIVIRDVTEEEKNK